jgi:YHS domain-containing protein
VDTALENAFNDMPEEKTEIEPAKPATPKETEESNPFSGLSLDEEFGPAPKPAAPTSDSDKPVTESATTDSPAIEPKEIIPDEIALPPEALPAEPAKEEVDAKMKLIAERGELRGLKGFCPVALRDERDLRNALPEHHSTFKGRTYYFSTADCKVAFDENPQQYAPNMGGQDVVLLKEKVTKDGSLDHAVWFKDRLYLFTSQKTLEQFVATPKEFAISE